MHYLGMSKLSPSHPHRYVLGILVVSHLSVAFPSRHLECPFVASSIVRFVPFGITFAFCIRNASLPSAVPRLALTLVHYSARDEALAVDSHVAVACSQFRGD